MRAYIACLLVLFLLGGCGFHLRGTHSGVELPFDTLKVEPYTPYDRFHQKLKQLLATHEVAIDNSGQNDRFRLILDPLEIKTLPVAYGANGELVREKIHMHMTYKLFDEEELVLDQSLFTERFHQVNHSNLLANQTEIALMQQDMQLDLLQQLITQLSHL
jgi:outer membrane lipopolysaccharide assembly protein LptE/RlpB